MDEIAKDARAYVAGHGGLVGSAVLRSLAEAVRDAVYPEAILRFDADKPDGAPRKLLDVGKLHGLGWKHRIDLESGIRSTYAWFLHNTAREAKKARAVHV